MTLFCVLLIFFFKVHQKQPFRKQLLRKIPLRKQPHRKQQQWKNLHMNQLYWAKKRIDLKKIQKHQPTLWF